MPKPVPYEQILREVMASRQGRPFEMPMRADSPAAIGSAMGSDPMQEAMKREILMKALASSFGTMANPETQMAQRGTAPKPGLVQLLMGLIK